MNQDLHFLPYMCKLSPEMERVFCNSDFTHRSAEFTKLYEQVRNGLCRMTGAKNAQIFCGSGTLANDVIAWQLKKLGGKGIIFTNGEFGERLINHALHAGLSFTAVKESWGTPVSESGLTEAIQKEAYRWIWFVHSETSTGAVNNMEEVNSIIKNHDLFVCADCISSIGNMPVNLSEIHMASCTSNKGLGSYPGLCMVLYNQLPESSSSNTPLYLDLNYYAEKEISPFTIPPALLACLNAGMCSKDERHYAKIRSMYQHLRKHLDELYITCFNRSAEPNPAVITFFPPGNYNSISLGNRLKSKGIILSYESTYLIKRNLLQISLMGSKTAPEVEFLCKELSAVLAGKKTADMAL